MTKTIKIDDNIVEVDGVRYVKEQPKKNKMVLRPKKGDRLYHNGEVYIADNNASILYYTPEYGKQMQKALATHRELLDQEGTGSEYAGGGS